MPGGRHDSSKTRVAPVFNQLCARQDQWIRTLLSLMQFNPERSSSIPALDYSFRIGGWGDAERTLDPPLALLSWLIRNLDRKKAAEDPHLQRQLLGKRDWKTTCEALRALRSSSATRAPWYVLEGPTHPDVYLETPDALVVIEGKRTERYPTTETKWMAGRHQMWRHIDAAWEIRGSRRVFGCFIVEGGDSASDVDVPDPWRDAFSSTIADDALASSFPHRSDFERKEIASCFVGGTTWQRVCATFGISYSALPSTIDDIKTIDVARSLE
jgi:hypothetical protein